MYFRLNRNVAAFRQFVEDVAAIWANLWTVYNPNGIKFDTIDPDGEQYTEIITAAELEDLRVSIRIDVSNNTPFSKFAQEQALEIALMRGHIAFEEYVDALDDDSNAPKAKFERILQNRLKFGMFGLPFELPPDVQSEKFDNIEGDVL